MLVKAELLAKKELEYPSGSAIVYHESQLYLMGDDAADLVVLDTAFAIVKSIPMFPDWEGRVTKAVKADIESADILKERGNDFLYLLGSGSKPPYRNNLFKVDLKNSEISQTNLSVLFGRMKKLGLKVLNIEAGTFIGKNLLLGNRSNKSFRQNYLMLVPSGFEKFQEGAALKVIPLVPGNLSAGISGMAYHARRDMLFLTFSEEETASAYQDGEVGDSYLGIINNITKKLDTDTLKIDAWLPLTSVDPAFKKIKVESIAPAERKKNAFVVFLVADNDDGKSILYKLGLKLEQAGLKR